MNVPIYFPPKNQWKTWRRLQLGHRFTTLSHGFGDAAFRQFVLPCCLEGSVRSMGSDRIRWVLLGKFSRLWNRKITQMIRKIIFQISVFVGFQHVSFQGWYCWWFRNLKANHLGCKKTLYVNYRISTTNLNWWFPDLWTIKQYCPWENHPFWSCNCPFQGLGWWSEQVLEMSRYNNEVRVQIRVST